MAGRYPGHSVLVALVVALLTIPGMAAAQDVPLIEAVKAGNMAALRAWLDKGADPNAQEVDGTTALHWAVHRDDSDAADLLIRAGANVRGTNRYGVGPLSLAGLNGSREMVARLLSAGADPNTTQPGGETAIMTAARAGNADVVKLLLAHGADVNAKEEWKGQTALMWAAAENNAAAVKALIEGGADIHARSKTSPGVAELGNKGFTAFLFAARAGQIDAGRTLVEAGANVNDTLTDGMSALVLAVMSAQYDMAAFLLDQGADPNAAGQGWTALHQISRTRRPNRGYNTVAPAPNGRVDSLSLVRKLIARGADVNARMTDEMPNIYGGRTLLNRIGATPFLMAASSVDLELMRLLVASGADPLLPTEDGTTPLMAAAGVGLIFPGENPGTAEESAEAVKLCLEHGGDATMVDANGDTALHGAAYWDSPGAVDLLVAAGAKLDVENKKGWTPLRVADGVQITASIHYSPATAARLRQLLKERGLPVPDPIFGGSGKRTGPVR